MTLRILKQKLRKALQVAPKRRLQLWLQMSGGVLAALEEEGHELGWWGVENNSEMFFTIEAV
jgi:hypothetical protein